MMKAAFFALAMFVALPVFAAESLQTLEPTTLFDGPSKKANPRFILSGGYPLKEISRVHGWRKVLIFSGEIGWVREKKTRPQQAVVVKNNNAAVRFEPSDDSPPIFFAVSNVVLDVLSKKARPGWLHVLHVNGESGYIAVTDVWLNY